MRRPALYSSSTRPAESAPAGAGGDSLSAAVAQPLARSGKLARLRRYVSPGNIYFLWSVVGVLALMLGYSLFMASRTGAQRLTQDDINAAVIKTLETKVLPSPAARAYDIISPSVVRVVGLSRETEEKTSKDAKESKNAKKAQPGKDPKNADKGKDGKDKDSKEAKEGPRSVGTGVVIVDKGIILTNLHVVQGADIIKITFADGLETTASVIGVQPENDLAVLQAHKIPDDMIAATMRSTADLRPGDQVMAVGFPFGIGPSASAGVISGLKRNFRSPEGKQEMTNLIQFDAAANPGNSGGPLVTMDGEVVGIVTAIYNPNQQRTFVGIGFAVPIENAAAAAGMPPF
ncbi:MAG: trypsin-like peptidase domain-containing protein [Pseudomonadota bacterium]